MPARIDPDAIPGKDIDPDAIELNAGTVATIAGQVRDSGANVHRKWQGMAAVYSAPEAGTVLDLMSPVNSQATLVGDNLDVVSGALAAFAEAVRPIKDALDQLRLDAQAFIEETNGGVSVREINPAWQSSQVSGSWNAYGAATDSDVEKYRTVTKEWHEVQEYVDRNNELISAVNAQQVALWEAERDCANKIRALYGADPLRSAQSEDDALGYGLDEIPEGTEMPWGAPVERTEGCGEATANFVFKDFLWEGIIVGGVWGTIQGLGTLTLGYNPATGEFFSGEAYGAAWGNLGLLAASGLMNSPVLAPLFWADQGMEALGGGGFLPQEVRDFKAQADEAALNTGKALIAWDKWQDDPGTALGESVFNVGTALIPVGGAAVAGVKTASTAASVISKVAHFADMVDPASWALNGTMRLGGAAVGSLDNLIGRLDLKAADVHLDAPQVYTAMDVDSAMRALDEWGVDLDSVTARTDANGNAVLEFPGGAIEMPGDAFTAGLRGGDGGADAAVPAPVREPELVNAGGIRGETGAGPVNSIVDDAPVRTETGGSAGESTVIRDPDTTTGGGGTHGGGGDPGSGGAGGGGQSYHFPDGSEYTPRTDRGSYSALDDAQPYIDVFAQQRGVSVAELHQLIHDTPVTSLTPDQARMLADLRESIPAPQPGELMQKVLSGADAEKLITSFYGPGQDTIGGFIARAADAKDLLTSSDLADGFGLDYGPGRTVPADFLGPDGSVGDVFAVRFEMSDAFDPRIPAKDLGDQAGLLFDQNGRPYYHPASVSPLGPENPYHGNGFVGSGSVETIPEYHLPDRVQAPNGTEVWRISPSGEEVLVATKLNGTWVRF